MGTFRIGSEISMKAKISVPCEAGVKKTETLSFRFQTHSWGRFGFDGAIGETRRQVGALFFVINEQNYKWQQCQKS